MPKNRKAHEPANRQAERELVAVIARAFADHEEEHSPPPQRRRPIKSLRKGLHEWSFRPLDDYGERQTVRIPIALYPTKREALRRANEIAAKLRPETPAPALSFATYVERYYVPDVLTKLGDDTQRTRRSILRKHAVPRFTDVRLHHVGARLQSWVDDMEAEADADDGSTIRARVAAVKAVLASARDEHGFDVGARVARVRYSIKAGVRRTRGEITFSEREARRILDAADGALRVAYRMLCQLGLRAAEVVGLPWRNVDFAARALHVTQQARRGKVVGLKTQESHATLALPDELLTELRTLRTAVPAAEYLLVSTRWPGQPMRTNLLRDRLAALCTRLGIPSKGPHALRRRFADSMLEAGVPLQKIQAAMRHADLATTVKYLSHARPEGVAAAIRAAAERFAAGDAEAAVVVELERARSRRKSTHAAPATLTPEHD